MTADKEPSSEEIESLYYDSLAEKEHCKMNKTTDNTKQNLNILIKEGKIIICPKCNLGFSKAFDKKLCPHNSRKDSVIEKRLNQL